MLAANAQNFDTKHLEIEASFGVFDGEKFFPGVKSSIEFANLKAYLATVDFSNVGGKLSVSNMDDVVEIMKDQKGNIRRRWDVTDPDNKIFEIKNRSDHRVNIPQYGVRITSSSEEEMIELKPDVEWIPTLRRLRKRTTYNNLYFNIDLTIVQEQHLEWVLGKETITKSFQKNEVEIELLYDFFTETKWMPVESWSNIKFIPVDVFFHTIINVYFGIIGYLRPFNDNLCFTMQEREYVVKLHNLLVNEKWRGRDKYRMYDVYWNQPRNITISDLRPKKETKGGFEGIVSIRGEDVNISGDAKSDIINLASNAKIAKKQWGVEVRVDFIKEEMAIDITQKIVDIIAKYKPHLTSTFRITGTAAKEIESYSFGSSYPTIKLNGKKMFLLIINYACWLVAPPYTITKLGRVIGGYDGTLIEGEITSFKYDMLTFHIFDVLFHKNRDVRNIPFVERYTLLRENMDENMNVYPIDIALTVKHFYMDGTIYQRVREAAEQYQILQRNYPGRTDGLIIQPQGKYLNKKTFKWKPSEELTIDFQFKHARQVEGRFAYFLFSKEDNKKATILFNPKNIWSHIYNDYVKFDGLVYLFDNVTLHGETIYEDAIIECRWNANKKTFEPVRLRDDRTQPNDYKKTAIQVWKDIHNPIALSTITGEDLVVMRKLHNQIKDNMLSFYLQPNNSIADFGSGRGGDLRKWKDLNLDNVYAVEPYEGNWTEFTRRLDEMNEQYKSMPNVKLIKYGAENTVDLQRDIGNTKINAMVSFFSMTFLGKSVEIYRKFLDTINLIPFGGYFLGIVMDGKRVKDLLAKERSIQSKTLEDVETEIQYLNMEIQSLMSLDIVHPKTLTRQKIPEISAPKVIDQDDLVGSILNRKPTNIHRQNIQAFRYDDPEYIKLIKQKNVLVSVINEYEQIMDIINRNLERINQIDKLLKEEKLSKQNLSEIKKEKKQLIEKNKELDEKYRKQADNNEADLLFDRINVFKDQLNEKLTTEQKDAIFLEIKHANLQKRLALATDPSTILLVKKDELGLLNEQIKKAQKRLEILQNENYKKMQGSSKQIEKTRQLLEQLQHQKDERTDRRKFGQKLRKYVQLNKIDEAQIKANEALFDNEELESAEVIDKIRINIETRKLKVIEFEKQGKTKDIKRLKDTINVFQERVDKYDNRVKVLSSLDETRKKNETLRAAINKRETIITKLRNLVLTDILVPITKDETVTYKNKAFEITQKSEINLDRKIGDPIPVVEEEKERKDFEDEELANVQFNETQKLVENTGETYEHLNEIETTINDPTSMVKNVTEWLFSFQDFQFDMKNLGFKLLSSTFIDGEDAKFLSPEAFEFSKLNRKFCFYRTPQKPSFNPPLNIGEETFIAVKHDMEGVLKSKGVPVKGGSFIHAVLEASDEKYRALSKGKIDVDAMVKYVFDFRATLAKYIDFNDYSRLHGGELMKRVAYQIKRDFQKDKEMDDDLANALAYKKYRQRLLNHNADVSDNSLLEILAKYLDISIYIVHITNYGIFPYFYDPISTYCDEITSRERCIVLIKGSLLESGSTYYKTGTAGDFYVLGRERVDIVEVEDVVSKNITLETEFQQGDLLIQNLKKKSCV